MRTNRIRNAAKYTIALCIGLSLGILLLEIMLRVHYPIRSRVDNDRIVLPAYEKYIINNCGIGKIDTKIIHTKNSLGFRGPEIPADIGRCLSILTVGGSTTECYYLSDNDTWPYLLGKKLEARYGRVWLNNAGLDGHSTFGHAILLRDYITNILRPNAIIFLVGVNDTGRADLSDFDKGQLRRDCGSWKRFIKKQSRIIRLILDIKALIKVYSEKTCHAAGVDLNKAGQLIIPETVIQKKILEHKIKFTEKYKERLLWLIELSKKNGIEPILVTQPSLLGGGQTDPATGTNLDTVMISDDMNGKLCWNILELYNDITKGVGAETGAYVIDLGRLLQKNSEYFYDYYHFTKKGAAAVSEILFEELARHWDQKYRPKD